MRQCNWKVIALAGALSLLTPRTFAATIMQTYSGSFPATITGTLPDQSSVLLEMFTLGSTSAVTVTTTSYATGGFEPNLFLFNPMGKSVGATVPFGAVDPKTGIVGDLRLTASNLVAGTYTLALTDFLLNQSLTATSLADGFTLNYGDGKTFVDANGNTRTGNYAFTIAATPSAVPEPGTFWLAVPLLAFVVQRARQFVR